MLRYIPWILLMLSLFSCFRKKTPPDNIETWLERQFPGRFSVQVSNLKILDVMAQYRGEKRALVADKADPDVQFFLNWQKGVEGLGLDTPAVAQALEHAKTEVAAAREWFGRLKNAGLQQLSVGVVNEWLTVQVFGEPTPALREQTRRTIQKTLKEQPDQSPTTVFIELLEPEAFHTEYQNIIPHGHWEVGRGWQKKNLILSWRMDTDPDAAPVWKYNPESERSARYQEDAFRQAKVWADKNLPQPFFMDPGFQYGFDPEPQEAGGKGLAIGFSFAYFDKQPEGGTAEPQGYVFGIYYPEERILTAVRKQRRF